MGQRLSIRDLRVVVPSGRVLLDLPALDLGPGQSLGISGPSGAGKSTLLFAVAGLSRHASGRVLWDNTDLLSLRAEERGAFRARHMGLVFQDFLLFEELDALGNASVGELFAPKSRRRDMRNRAARLLDRLGIRDPARPVAAFSGGERQRVAIARALANDADILLADEPTASLDRTAADRLIDDLTALCRERGKTLIAISHDRALLDRLDMRLHLTDGHAADPATLRVAR